MGFNNRDYMQDDDQFDRQNWFQDIPTTKWLLIVTIVTFFLQTVQSLNIESLLSLDATRVQHGQIWRLLTYTFCHDRENPFGLVFNMLLLWFMGSVLERMYGSREILFFYLAAAVFSGLVFVGFGLNLLLPIPLMGSDPGVMALFALYATHFPRQEILFAWLIPVQIQVLLWIYVAIDAYIILQATQRQTPWARVAYMSALWGIAFGFLYRKFQWRLAGIADLVNPKRLQQSIRRARAARRLKVFQPEPMSNLDEQVDAILAKIHEHGSDSLTERERGILQRASEQAKNRQ